MPGNDKSKSLLEAVEARMRQAETFAWAVPALALTAQALLLTVVFNDSTTAVGRLLASLTGLITVLAALHLLGKHTFNFDMYEAVVERERKALGLPGVSRKSSCWMPCPFRTRAASVNATGWLSSQARRDFAAHG
jgi:hypothetical protein